MGWPSGFDEFYIKHGPSLKQFAGLTINVAAVFFSLVDRKPKQITRIDYMRFKVDPNGALDQTQIDDGFRLVANRIGKILGEERPTKKSGPVVNAIDQFDERRWAQLHPKLPGPAHKRIIEIIFGGAHS